MVTYVIAKNYEVKQQVVVVYAYWGNSRSELSTSKLGPSEFATRALRGVLVGEEGKDIGEELPPRESYS